MYFSSENWAGAHPAISAALSAHATGFASAYGTSDLDREVERRFTNALALTVVAKPGGVVFAHRDAHIVVTEGGAPEYLSGQLRLATVDGMHGKINAHRLRRQVKELADGDVHGGRPVAISVSQSTESGAVYSMAELDTISAVARDFNLALHMDGARFANGLATLGCSPAEMTWKRGVDMLSFGATKNGCWCAEAVVLFDPASAKAGEFIYTLKRSAQLFSKTRFISAQLKAYFSNDLWLTVAQQSNSKARLLAEAFAGLDPSHARLARKPETSELFVNLTLNSSVLFEPKASSSANGPNLPDSKIPQMTNSFAVLSHASPRRPSTLFASVTCYMQPPSSFNPEIDRGS